MENDSDFECADNSESLLDASVISLCGRVTNAPNYSGSDVTPQITDVTTPNISFRDESNNFQEILVCVVQIVQIMMKNHKPLNLINLLKLYQQTIF